MTDFDANIYAALVFDGKQLSIPATRMGVPREDQLQGTNLERLAELAGRVCYDSLGKGRGSKEYHEHILEVRHLSVLEHCTFTVAFREDPSKLIETVMLVPKAIPPNPDFYWRLLPALINRPGVWVETDKRRGFKALRVTCNLRAVLEWSDWTPHVETYFVVLEYLGWALRSFAHKLAPQVIPDPGVFDPEFAQHCPYLATLVTNNPNEPQWHNDDERWVSLFLGMSRGCSHELVRHGDFTAISQRSTRYVDESESHWLMHPVESEFWRWLYPIEPANFPAWYRHVGTTIGTVWEGDGQTPASQYVPDAVEQYADRVKLFEAWLVNEKGADKHTARKQARGAARGKLGNSLYTEMIFSANVAQWQRMLRARCSNQADAEIRVLFSRILPQLQRSQHGECFRGLQLVPADDGIGEVLAGG
jgi:thymidylate synthase ThyX